MAKDILIFSDGTGQIGGLRPDQCLSNVYKMYRAMRPGPDSPISPNEQVAFYDAGLGAGETGGLTFKRVRNFFAAAVGTGIDENVIDCYAAIIANYEPGDRIHLFGFSRGAYTARTVANVLNLCGVPTEDGRGRPVPRFGPALRKIASDAVRYVYNHGAGKKRDKYEDQREEKARRFRKKYASEGIGAEGEGQGNVQPTFVGVFDTVAALGSRAATLVSLFAFTVVLLLAIYIYSIAPIWLWLPFALLPAVMAFWALGSFFSQFKYFFKDESRRLRLWNPLDWIAAVRHGHMAWWSGKNYDRYVDREVPFLRHALSIDEARTKFPRVGWGRGEDVAWNAERGNSGWIKQVWFAGNHSDIGGSYPEEESRLSDIALQWMVDELVSAVPTVKIRRDLLVTSPDPLALQHDEIQAVLDMQPGWFRTVTFDRLTWSRKPRQIHQEADLHPTVLERLDAEHVAQMDKTMRYRPANLKQHKSAARYFAG
ncbi:MAG: DUF2235 domain-containing protein [Alphaproteobacteria bacterium]|nr:DUF2235 domain-containing protein [Alphaproteobacteria bacterium]